MATGAVSGRYGDVKIGSTQVCDVQKWSFNPKVQINSYASNCTNQTKKKVAGTKDGTGTLDGLYNPAEPIMITMDVGTSVTLKLYLTATVFYSVPAIIESLKVDVDMDTGDFVKWSATFQADGAWTNPIAGQFAEPPEEMEPENSPVAEMRPMRTPARPVSEDRLDEAINSRLTAFKHEMLSEMYQTVGVMTAQAVQAVMEQYFKPPVGTEQPTEQPAAQAA